MMTIKQFRKIQGILDNGGAVLAVVEKYDYIEPEKVMITENTDMSDLLDLVYATDVTFYKYDKDKHRYFDMERI